MAISPDPSMRPKMKFSLALPTKIDNVSSEGSVSSPPSLATNTSQKTNRVGLSMLGLTGIKSTKTESTPIKRDSIRHSQDLPEAKPFASQMQDLQQLVEGSKVLDTIVSTEKPLTGDPKLNDLVQSVQIKDMEGFKSKIAQIPKHEVGPLVNELLKTLALQEKGEHYDFLMKGLKEIFPNIEAYLNHVVTPEASGDVVSPQGMRELIGILQKEKSLTLPCIVCEDYKQFEEELANLKSTESDQKVCFIVRNRNPNGNQVHVTPVYIEKKGKAFRCAVTDSMGKDQLYTHMVASLISKNIEKEAASFTTFCYTNSKRQQDNTNCPIFCLRDYLYFAKNPDVLDYFEAKASLAKEKSKIPNRVNFEQLPPAMMRTTQFISKIKDYDANSDGGASRSVYEKLKGGHRLKPAQHKGKDTEFNLYVEQKFLKYERLLIARVVQEALK